MPTAPGHCAPCRREAGYHLQRVEVRMEEQSRRMSGAFSAGGRGRGIGGGVGAGPKEVLDWEGEREGGAKGRNSSWPKERPLGGSCEQATPSQLR